jgi:transcriptional antiterminator NusG
MACRREGALTAPTGQQALVRGSRLFRHGKSVQRALTERIARAGMEDKFGRILVPTEEVIEGQKWSQVGDRTSFHLPWHMYWSKWKMTDETWHLVKNTSKVTGFIGGKSNKPTPIPAR